MVKAMDRQTPQTDAMIERLHIQYFTLMAVKPVRVCFSVMEGYKHPTVLMSGCVLFLERDRQCPFVYGEAVMTYGQM